MASIWEFLDGLPKRGDVSPEELEARRQGYADLYQGGLLARNRDQMPLSVQGAQATQDFLPVIGDALALGEAGEALSRGELAAAGLLGTAGIIGLVPGAGDVLAKPVMAAGRRAADIARRIEVDPNAFGSMGGNIRLRPQAGGEIGIHKSNVDFKDIDLSKSADNTFWMASPDADWSNIVATGSDYSHQFEISPKAKLATWDDIDKYSVGELEARGFDGVRMDDGGGDVTYQIWNTDMLQRLSPTPTSPAQEVAGLLSSGRVDESIGGVLSDKYPDIAVDLFGDPDRGYELSRIVVPEGERNRGVGSKVMRDIVNMADAQGAKVSLTPDSSFGGNKTRLKDFYKRFGFVENKGRNKDFSTRNTMYRPPQAPTATPAQEVAGLLSSGRAADVTDEMLAKLTPKDEMELFDLYQRGATGMDLPMDEASRMARAGELGFNAPSYHGTEVDFQSAQSDFYTTPDPEYANVYAGSVYDEGGLVLPLMQREGDILDTRTPIGEKVFNENFYMQYGNASPLTGKGLPDWVEGPDFVEMFTEKYLPYKGVFLDEGKVPLGDGTILDRGVSALHFDPSNVRSRFARFDPRLAHLRNLSAGVGGLGLLSSIMPQEEQY